MKTETKIIKSLIEDGEMTIRELSKKIKADYKISHMAVNNLIKKKVINTKNIGNSILCSLNKDYFGIELYKAEDERRTEILKNKDINQLLKHVLYKVKTTFFVLLLFGSYAKRTQTKNSDIDLILIFRESGFEDKINEILSLIPLKTHSLVFTEEEFVRMKDSKESNVVKEALSKYVVLYNIESFYRLKND
mgnify:CR=1 FL=1